jgi:hypothetical protein
LAVSGIDQFPGELDNLRADSTRLLRQLQLSKEQARAAAIDQATLVGERESPVSVPSILGDPITFLGYTSATMTFRAHQWLMIRTETVDVNAVRSARRPRI